MKSWSKLISRHQEPLVPIAIITRTQGRRGQVRVRIEFDDSRLFEAGRRVVLTLEKENLEAMDTVIEDFRFQHGRWVAKLKDIDSISDAKGWIGGRISVTESALPPLEEGSFFSFDLEGCEMYEGGDRIGTVTNVLDYGGTALLRVDRNGEEVLVPFAKSYLKKIDTAAKRIDVELPEGLLGLNE